MGTGHVWSCRRESSSHRDWSRHRDWSCRHELVESNQQAPVAGLVPARLGASRLLAEPDSSPRQARRQDATGGSGTDPAERRSEDSNDACLLPPNGTWRLALFVPLRRLRLTRRPMPVEMYDPRHWVDIRETHALYDLRLPWQWAVTGCSPKPSSRERSHARKRQQHQHVMRTMRSVQLAAIQSLAPVEPLPSLEPGARGSPCATRQT